MKNKRLAKTGIAVAIVCLIVAGTVFAGQGQVKREIWYTTDVDETKVQTALDWISSHNPDSAELLTKVDFNGFHDNGITDPALGGVDNYVARVTGWIVPKVTGNYSFRITSDDTSGLWLSNDDSVPTGLTPTTAICKVDGWTGYRDWNSASAGKSGNIPLIAGQAYAFTVIMIEGGGGDNLSVAWSSAEAGIADKTVLEGEFLSDTNPIRASIPTPADGATNVVEDSLQLGWTVPWALTSPKYSVYLGTINTSDPNQTQDNPKVAADLTAPSFVVNNLQTSTTYYWRVDCAAKDANGVPVVQKGSLWSFTTVPSTPVIFRQPVSVLANAGQKVTFDFNVYSAGNAALTYAWKKVGDPGFASESKDLVIAAAQVSDEGDYYCEITNASGTVTTDTVYLAVKRLVGRWPFDGNVTDVVSGIPTVTQTGNPATYDAGKAGQAISMDQVTINPVVISTPAWAQAHRSWTISVWENMPDTTPGTYPYMMASGTDATGIDRFFFWRYTGGADYEFRFYEGSTILLQLWGYGFAKTQWHLVTATYDAATDTAKIYVDGVPRQTGTVSNYAGFAPEIYVGNRKNLARPYLGKLDDLRLYNYAIDDFEAARLYVDFNPGTVICVKDIAMDLNKDCRIGLEDFAIFAEQWMACNRNPKASCP